MSAPAATAIAVKCGWDRVNELTEPLALPTTVALELLNCGEITIEGRVNTASNTTMYCRIESGQLAAACVYKPVSGERPLWDYPDGTLAEREVAAYLISEAIGWKLIPPTVLRSGPLGTGMVQLWVADDESFDTISAINAGSYPQLQRMALLDAVLNNSDRKVSHLLPVTGYPDAGPTAPDALHIFGIDHGVSLGIENKLRTVLWQWAGKSISDEGILALQQLGAQLDGELGEELSGLLTTIELRALGRRVQRLLAKHKYPMPPTDWPAIPYPPY